MSRLLKFLIVGASGASISLTILWLLTALAGWHYMLSYLVAFAISVSNNYLLNSLWTFNDKKAHFTGLSKYMLMSLATLSFRELLLYLFTDIAGIWYMASGVIAISIVCILNFVLSRKFIWNKPKYKYEVV